MEAAFEEWGRTNYCSTSLSSLARRLSLTKPALYRYFPNKDSLVRALEDECFEGYYLMNQEFLEDSLGLDLPAAIYRLLELHYRFFTGRSYLYVFFLMQILRRPLPERVEARRVFIRVMKRLRALLAAEGIERGGAALQVSVSYLYGALIFWLSDLFMDEETRRPLSPQEAGADSEAVLRSAFALLWEGLAPSCAGDQLDYEAIEEAAAVTPEELPIPDRIFTAIEAVVARDGLADATVDKIAAHVGMSKSSLYFYFANKNDMLGSMVRREQDSISRLMREKTSPYTAFGECSYAHMVVAATYTYNNPRLLTVFNWLRFQNIEVDFAPPSASHVEDYFGFFVAAAQSGILAVHPTRAVKAAVGLHVLTFREIADLTATGISRPLMFERLRLLHSLYLKGFLSIGTRAVREECREVEK